MIGGHQRLVAARRLGLKTVPVILLDIGQKQARLLNKEDVIKRAERCAVREVAFLFYLHSQLNSRIWGEWKAMCLLLAFVASELKFLCQQDDPKDDDLQEATERVIHSVLEFHQWQLAAGRIAQRYYAGTWLIFPGYAELLSSSLETAELVVTMFYQQLDWITWCRSESKTSKASKGKRKKTPPPAVEPIDLEALKESSVPIAVELAQHLVTIAKAEAASFMGETREALAMVKARLWPERN